MTTTEFCKKNIGIRGAHKLTEADRKRIIRQYLMALDFEFEVNIYNIGRINGSRMIDHDAKAMGINVDWRG